MSRQRSSSCMNAVATVWRCAASVASLASTPSCPKTSRGRPAAYHPSPLAPTLHPLPHRYLSLSHHLCPHAHPRSLAPFTSTLTPLTLTPPRSLEPPPPPSASPSIPPPPPHRAASSRLWPHRCTTAHATAPSASGCSPSALAPRHFATRPRTTRQRTPSRAVRRSAASHRTSAPARGSPSSIPTVTRTR